MNSDANSLSSASANTTGPIYWGKLTPEGERRAVAFGELLEALHVARHAIELLNCLAVPRQDLCETLVLIDSAIALAETGHE